MPHKAALKNLAKTTIQRLLNCNNSTFVTTLSINYNIITIVVKTNRN